MPKKNGLETTNDNSMINFYAHKQMKKYLTDYHNPHFDNHQIKVPFRLVVIASSGGGKTQWFLNLIAKMNDTFGHIYVCYRTSEPLYDFLQAEKITFITQLAEFPPLSEIPKDKRILLYQKSRRISRYYVYLMMSLITRIKNKES